MYNDARFYFDFLFLCKANFNFMNPKKFIFAFFLSLIFVFAAQAQTDCLNYEPENVTLSGKLARLSIKNVSGQKETIYVLKLKTPVCVNADPENEYNPQQNDVKDVQLAFDAEKYKSSRLLLNKNVMVSGTLFGEHTQHHFTKVLMSVSEIK